jgi:hypothetical protein
VSAAMADFSGEDTTSRSGIYADVVRGSTKLRQFERGKITIAIARSGCDERTDN